MSRPTSAELPAADKTKKTIDTQGVSETMVLQQRRAEILGEKTNGE